MRVLLFPPFKWSHHEYAEDPSVPAGTQEQSSAVRIKRGQPADGWYLQTTGDGGPGASASWDKLCGEHQLMAEQLPWSPQHGRA